MGFALLLPAIGGAEEFRYTHRAGDSYRILSVVNEDVYLNRRLSHRAEILNRVAVVVLAEEGGAGRHEALFQTSERALGTGEGVFSWEREYRSVFDRDSLGRLTIDGSYFMPVVRNVPVFPGGNLEPGDTWRAEGHETHDFRDSFGIAEPYRISFIADYRYLGTRQWEGREYPAFSVSYRIDDSPPAVRGRLWPRRIVGACDQILYWDRELGQSRAYEESFRMLFELSDGTQVEYRGTAHAEILESPRMDKDQVAGEIKRDLEGLEDTEVRIDEEGVTISLEAIRFEADSARLLPSEQAKLDRIAEILTRYAGRDILVAGHTALAGSAAGRQELSVQRAAAVASYLIDRGVRSGERVVVRGYGAERPVADNATAEGRERNRRVEITILEN
ncbi:MAG: OmpA family protein [Treponema sp.]|jgi:outer membrane protein OmpA-like peptidoglycan-associated protein|nr:OmpA family protein [Treponema sp.]